jgi:riboflavin synthase
VNLERPLRMGDGLDGHQVQGHVDGVGEVMGIDESDGWRIRVGVPEGLRSSMIPKGSVTIDGVSLTLAAVAEDGSWIECAIIPETLKRTTISERVKGDRVNLEGDVLVKAIVATMARMGVGSR